MSVDLTLLKDRSAVNFEDGSIVLVLLVVAHPCRTEPSDCCMYCQLQALILGGPYIWPAVDEALEGLGGAQER